MKHVEPEILIELYERGQRSDLESGSAAHLAACGSCSEFDAKLAAFFLLADRATEPVPQATTARLLNIYQRPPAPVITRSVGVLSSIQFDDWTMALTERHAQKDMRHLLLKVGDVRVDLRLEFGAEGCVVSGQLFPDAPHARLVLAGEAGHAETTANDESEFHFDPVGLGVYELSIVSSQIDLKLTDLPLTR